VRVYIFAFGKLKTSGLRDAADYYKRLLQPWVSVEEIEIKPLHIPEKSPAVRTRIQKREAEILNDKLIGRITSRGAIYLLDETGKTLRTKDWASLTSSWEDLGTSEVALCLGSSLGFGDLIRNKARGTLSLGAQTLSHELARVVLFEQLYRAWSVTRGHPYHNDN
jgi:23S rRNA (pseudouridine1915-N3)-methyltransferase